MIFLGLKLAPLFGLVAPAFCDFCVIFRISKISRLSPFFISFEESELLFYCRIFPLFSFLCRFGESGFEFRHIYSKCWIFEHINWSPIKKSNIKFVFALSIFSCAGALSPPFWSGCPRILRFLCHFSDFQDFPFIVIFHLVRGI